MTEEIKFEDYDTQWNEIEAERNNRPYIGKIEKLDAIASEYSDLDILQKLSTLGKMYSGVRRIRGDGNCFYRALAFGIFWHFLKNRDILTLQKMNLAFSDKTELLLAGYDEYIFEDFQSVLLDLFKKIEKGLSEQDLENIFLNPDTTDYIVVYMRLLTSAYIQSHPDDFEPFLYEYSSLIDFCRKEVESMGKEADNIQISAITSRLPVCIRIEYLDTKSQNTMIFPEGQTPMMTLLYRPGHYDILY